MIRAATSPGAATAAADSSAEALGANPHLPPNSRCQPLAVRGGMLAFALPFDVESSLAFNGADPSHERQPFKPASLPTRAAARPAVPAATRPPPHFAVAEQHVPATQPLAGSASIQRSRSFSDGMHWRLAAGERDNCALVRAADGFVQRAHRGDL